MLRRDVLKSLAALAALPAAAWAEEPGLQLAAEATAFDQGQCIGPRPRIGARALHPATADP